MVSAFSDADRERILSEARETLQRPMPGADRVPRADDVLASYRRSREPDPEPRRDWPLTDSEAARLEARLVGLVASEREFVLTVVGEALGLFMKQLRDEIAESVGLLKADVTLHRAIDQGTVTELPNPILRKTS